MNPLNVLVVANSKETQAALTKQLQGFSFLKFDHVVLELYEAQKLWQKEQPDLLIIDLTGRELDSCLFIEAINYNVENKTIVFGLHSVLDPTVIMKAVSSGVKEFIHYPQDEPALGIALEKHWKHLQKLHKAERSEKSDNSSHLTTVFASKGGSGSSTVAVNTAHQLVKMTKKPVVLLDMDQLFSNTAVMLNFKANYALSDLVSEKTAEIDDDLLAKIVVHHETGLDVVVACKHVLDENALIPSALLDRLLAYCRAHYAYIVVDLPTHVIDVYHQYFVEQADQVLLVSSLDIPGLYRTRQYLELAKRHMDLGKVKLVLNRWDLKSTVGLSSDAIEAEFKYPIYARLPNNWQLGVEAMSLGQALAQVNPNADLVKAYEQLVSGFTDIQTLAPEVEAVPTKTMKLFPFFSMRKQPV